MKVKDYLKEIGLNENSSKYLRFTISKTIIESEHCKEIYYYNSPVRCIWEWFNSLKRDTNPEKNILNYNVLNINVSHNAWLSGVDWNYAIKSGQIVSLLVISDEEIEKYYSKQQCKSTIEYCEQKIKNIIRKNN